VKLAIIDADSLVYEAAFSGQSTIEWETGNPETSLDLDAAIAHFKAAIDSIMRATGCDEKIVCISCPHREENFRRVIYEPYKANRKAGNRPLLLEALNQWVKQEYDAKVKHGIEADDTVGILATADLPSLPPREQRVIVALDKDLDTIPGLHYSWMHPDLGVVEVSESAADYWHMYQTLTGDSTDNYPGVRGIGPKRATKILDESFPNMWPAVLAAFEAKGFDEEFALTQARLARILRAEDYDFTNEAPILWTPED
jgi:DNA polymerase-1